MKNKYDEAYCRSEKKNYALDDVIFLYHNDFITYATVLDGDLLCPDCHKVRLSFVNSSHPHFRGYRGEDHLDGCMYALEEMPSSEVSNLLRTQFGEFTIIRQMERILVQFLHTSDGENAVPLLDQLSGVDKANFSVFKKQRAKSMIPRKQLNAPFQNSDYNTEKIFYGKAHLVWEENEKSGGMKLLIRSLKTGRLICKLFITSKTINKMNERCRKDKEYDAFVVFFASLERKKPTQTWCHGVLKKSTLISINRISEDSKHPTKRNG